MLHLSKYKFSAHLAQMAMAAIAITWRPSFVVRRPLTFYILIFSETARSNGTKLGRKHLWNAFYKVSSFGLV